jgi:hypothetical protein
MPTSLHAASTTGSSTSPVDSYLGQGHLPTGEPLVERRFAAKPLHVRAIPKVALLRHLRRSS